MPLPSGGLLTTALYGIPSITGRNRSAMFLSMDGTLCSRRAGMGKSAQTRMAIRGRIFGSLPSTNTPPPARERERLAMSHYWRGLAAAISLFISTYGHGALVPRFAYVANNQDHTVSMFGTRGSRLHR